jgi:uncharacterized protein with HEPN domain
VRDDRVYLRHILESIDLVERYLAGPDGRVNEELFRDDPRTQDAVLRRMETLADAASHLSDALKARHPDLAWREVSDFRNILAHGYTELRFELIWDTIVRDLPDLKTVAREELSRAEGT